jgi:DNA repair protein RadD
MVYALRDYQESVVAAVIAFAKYRSGNGYATAAGGSGKSVMIAAVADLLKEAGFRVVILARNEKLLTQNRAKLKSPSETGIYCAGLGERDASKPITIASIQSICEASPNVIGRFDFALVDECDEIHPDAESDTQYWQFFRTCGMPRILGFTATPFRTQSGLIKWGDEIINIPIAPLIQRGYILPPVNKVGVQLDLSAIPINIGDYAQDKLNTLYTDPNLLHISVEKIIQYSTARNCNLVFTQSLAHADVLAFALESSGELCVIVSGDTDKDELNDYILPSHEAGDFKHLLTCDLLAVGYDMPWIDMVTILKATKSKRKFEQMVYRGTRTYENKQREIFKRDFLLLDMGNNLQEHGALGSPYKEKPSKQERASPKGKICPECETWVQPIIMQCSDCGFEFPENESRKIDHKRDADTYNATFYTGDI